MDGPLRVPGPATMNARWGGQARCSGTGRSGAVDGPLRGKRVWGTLSKAFATCQTLPKKDRI